MTARKIEDFFLRNLRWALLAGIIIFFFILFSWHIKYVKQKYFLPKHIHIGITVNEHSYDNQQQLNKFLEEVAAIIMKKLGKPYTLHHLSDQELFQHVYECDLHFGITTKTDLNDQDIFVIHLFANDSCLSFPICIIISRIQEDFSFFIEAALKSMTNDGSLETLVKKYNLAS